jgi:fibronectin-binding autotransporter adhesin
MKILAALIATAASASAATFTWTGATDGNWNTGANWTGGVPASATDTALVFDNTTQPATANNTPGGLTLNSLTFAAGAGARALSGNTLTFDGVAPTLVNTSTGGHITIGNDISLAQTLTVTGGPTTSAQLITDGVISGAGGLTFTGGLSTLRGASSYTGATVLQNSALVGVVGNNALGATSSVTVGPGAELQLIRVGPSTGTTINRALTLAGTLSSQSKKMDNGLAQPIPSTRYSGAITLSGDARILTFGATGSGFDSAEFVVSGPVALAGNTLTLTTAGSQNTTTLGAISGNGNVVFKPAGGAVSATSISGNGNVSLTGVGGSATLGSLSGDGNLTIAADNGFTSLSVAGAITGNRNISVTSGSLSLGSTSNTFTGTVEVANSSLSVPSEASLGNAANAITLRDGAMLAFTSSATLTRPIAIPSGTASININALFDANFSGNISGAGQLGLVNFGLQRFVTLGGTNSFQGGLTFGTGIIVTYTTDANLGQAGGAIIFGSGGSLALPNTVTTFNRPIETNNAFTPPLMSGGSISAAVGQTVTLAGAISGTGKLTLGGGAIYTIGGTNTAAGGLDVIGNNSQPTLLEIGSDAQIGGPTGALNLGRQNGFFVLPGTLRATGDLAIAATRSTTFRGMTVDTNGHAVTFNQPITGRDMTKTGAGTWILNTANTDNSGSNFVSIEQGTLRLGVNDALGPQAGIQSIADGAILDLNGFDLDVGSINNTAATSEIRLGAGGILAIRSGQLSGTISGSGDLVFGKVGFSSSSAVISGDNTFIGSVTIHEGASVFLQHGNALGAAGNAVTIDNGTLGIGSGAASPLAITNTSNLTIGSGGATFQADGQSIIIERQLTGSSPLKFRGGSSPGSEPKYEVRLANATNTFTGNIQLGDAHNFSGSPAIIGIIANGSLGNTANILTLGDHYYDGESNRTARGGIRAYADLTIPASRALQLDGFTSDASSSGGIIDTNGHTMVIETSIGQATADMQLLKTGEGTLLLNGTNTYTGPTIVSQGTLAGTGTVEKITVEFEATLDPGEYGSGLLTVNDSVEFSGGTLAMQLSGTTRGSSYDALDVGGSLSLGGAALVLDFAGGFQSSILFSDVFVLADSFSLSGDFGNITSGNRLDIDGLGSFLVSYGAGSAFDVNSVVLSEFTAVPEPSTWALGIAAALVAIALKRHRAQ